MAYLSSNEIQSGVIPLLAYPGCPGKWPVTECRSCCFTFSATLLIPGLLCLQPSLYNEVYSHKNSTCRSIKR